MEAFAAPESEPKMRAPARWLRMTEIALSTGYASQAAFGVAFRRVAGVTPGQWRRERAR